MSRYLILFLLNLPFIILGLISAIAKYKLKKTSKKRLFAQIFLWLAVLLGLILAEPIYNWLFTNNLTETEPLSLFDVIQISAIVITYYIANRAYSKIESLEKKVQDLHQELSIRLSK